MRRGRGSRVPAVCAALALAVVASVPALQTRERPTEVAGVSFERSSAAASRGATGFSALSRLRRPDAPISPVAVVPPPVGDVAIAPPPETFETPAAPEPVPPAPTIIRPSRYEGVAPAGGTWALIIGINDYPGSRYDLRSALADAEDVNAALAKLGVPGDHRVVLRDRQANADTIRVGLDWLTAHAGPDATAVFFYAGHVRKLGGGTEAIVAADGGVITDDELAGSLGRLQARQAWIGMAACYAGGFTEVLAAGRVLTAAAPANALAYENETFGRSYLVEYMVRRGMLQERADRSVESAYAFAETELRRDYPNRVPVQYDYVEGDLDLRPSRPHTTQSAGGSPPPSGDASGGSAGGGSAGDGSGGGTAGGGTDGGGSGDSPDDRDACTSLTVGLVRCKD